MARSFTVDRNDTVSVAMAQAIECWPKLPPLMGAFRDHIAQLEVCASDLERHGKELYLVVACLHRDRSAIEILERSFLRKSEQVIARVNDDVAFVDEVRQELRERLLVAAPPAMAQYAATGPLGAWLRVAALRTALNVKKADDRWYSRTCDEAVESSILDGREGGIQRVVQDALDSAIGSLDNQERDLLRLFYLDRVTIQSIARKYGTHRATITRWLELTRRHLSAAVITRVGEALGVSEGEARREVAHVHLGLEITDL
jgi:RNA polymerase sigma-70 factor, ECF subfamily